MPKSHKSTNFPEIPSGDDNIKMDTDSAWESRFWLLAGLVVGSAFILGGTFYQDAEFFTKFIQSSSKVEKLFGLAPTFLKEFGIAIFILFGIQLLEKKSKGLFFNKIRNTQEKFINAFRENAFLAVYGGMAPVPILEEMQKQILTRGLIRKNFHITYTLSTIPQDMEQKIDVGCREAGLEDRALLEIKTLFKIKNLRSQPFSYTPRCSVEKEDAPVFNRAYFMRIKLSGNVEPVIYDETALQSRKKDDGINLRFEMDEVKIPPNGEIEIETCYRNIRGIIHTREVFTCLIPTESVKVEFKSNIPDLDLHIEALSPNEMIFCRKSSTATFGMDCEWELDYPLLPYQGIMLWWHRKPAVGKIEGECAT